MLADAKAQHLEVKQIFREWKPLGASVVASWRITAAPLLRLRKVPLRAYADVERIFAFERKIKPMLKTLKTEVRAAKAAKDAAAREMDDFDRSVRRRVARDVLGIPMSRIIVLIEIGKCTCAEGVSSLLFLLLYGIVCERERNGPQPPAGGLLESRGALQSRESRVLRAGGALLMVHSPQVHQGRGRGHRGHPAAGRRPRPGHEL